MNPEASVTKTLNCLQENLKWIKEEFSKEPGFIDKRYPNMNERLEVMMDKLLPRCLRQGTELENQCTSNYSELARMGHELNRVKSRLKSLEGNESKEITQQGIDHIRKIHGHEVKDEADPQTPVTKYSQLFKSTFDPLYDTLEGVTFNFNEDESLFVVNRMFQIIYTKCTELLISKMNRQLEKLFVQQRELSDIEKERMTDTQYAFGLLLHAANIKECQLSDDIEMIIATLCESTLIKSVFEKMDKQNLELLIKEAVDIIQSFLTLVPPMVVDKSLYPDMKSGAYPGKKNAEPTSEHYVTTRSALFYSYKGESVARTGQYASTSSIKEEILTQTADYAHTSVQRNSLSGKEFPHPLCKAPEEVEGEKELEIQQSEDQTNCSSKLFQNQTFTQTEMNLQLIVTEIQDVKQTILRHQQQQDQRHEQQLHDFHVLMESVRQDNQKLHEITRRNQEMETTIQRQDEQICHHTEIENLQWIIESDEIEKTQEEVGGGGWKVGVFRGTRVAVKCLHEISLCKDNFALFTREINIAFRVCHPNLLQFIGATKVGNPMILTELMPTSLRKEMNKKHLTRPQILNISRDVASALNYLHLWKPEAILHRGVCSPNVLLEPSGHDQWKVKLSDYGSLNIQQKLSSKPGPGNPAYAAPESRYPNDHSPAMDVYSFGVLLLEMIVHHLPPLDQTTREKHNLVMTITWSHMRTLVLRCTKEGKNERPIMSDILKRLLETTILT